MIYFAWGVEIIAASIGLMIAAFVILATRENIVASGIEISAAAGYMNMFLGGLPFIVVAMVELTKIPLATACYITASRVWTTAFAVALIVLSIITFETILNGFERNFTLRTYELSTMKKKLTNLEERVDKSEQDLKNVSQASEAQVRQTYRAEIDQIENEKQDALEDIDKERNAARIRFGGEEAKLKDGQRKTVEEDLRKLEKSRTTEMATINDRYRIAMERIDESVRDRRSALSTQIQGLNAKLADSRRREVEMLSKVREGGNISDPLAENLARIKKDFGERSAAAREAIDQSGRDLDAQIAAQKTDIKAVESEMQNKLDEATIFTDSDKIRADYAARITPRRESLKGLEKKRNALSIARTVRELNAEKDGQIDAAQSRFADLGSRAERERADIRNASAAERERDQQQLQTFQGQITALSTSSQIDLATKRRDDDRASLTKEIDARRRELRARIDKLSEEILVITSGSMQNLGPVLQKLDDRRVSIIGRADRRKQDLQQKYEADLARLAERDAEMRRTESELKDMRDQRIRLRKEFARQAQDSQIYRITALWFGKESPADITNAQLRWVTIVWFGSLAAITAWTGTILAFGGLVAMYGRRERRLGLVSRATRALLVDWRRRVRRPVIKIVEKEVVKTVEVVKEIPVDKVVFKEVPKEIVRKELVYVPIFTDDPELAREQLAGQDDDGRSANVEKSKV